MKFLGESFAERLKKIVSQDKKKIKINLVRPKIEVRGYRTNLVKWLSFCTSLV